MKLFLKLLFAAAILPAVITFSSCDDEKDPEGGSLIGTWRFTSTTSAQCIDPDDNGSETCTVACHTLTFTATTIVSSHDPSDVIPYTLNGDQIIIADDDDEKVTFSITGSVLTLTFDDEDGDCIEVNTYTKGDLIPELVVSVTTVEIGPEGGTAQIGVTANVGWTATSSESWLTVFPGSGPGEGTQPVVFTAEPNTLAEPRMATVTITGTGLTAQTITITQGAAEGITPESLVGTWLLISSEGTEWEKDDGIITPRAAEPSTLNAVLTITATTVHIVSASDEEFGTFNYTITDGEMVHLEGIGDFTISDFTGTGMQWDQRDPSEDADYEYNEEGDNYLYFQKFWTLEKQ